MASGCPRDRLGWPLEREWGLGVVRERGLGCQEERGGEGQAASGSQERREHWPSGAALWRELEEREKGAGASGRHAGVERTLRGIDWPTGRLEVVGGRGVNSRVPCQVLQSATLAGIRGFPASTRIHLRMPAEGGVGKSWGEPWMLWKAEGREGG